MNRITALLASLTFALLLIISPLLAQSGRFAINLWGVANGGGESRGNTYTVSGMIGQPHAGAPLVGARYRVEGGLWPASSTTVIDDGGTVQLYLPVIGNPPTPPPIPTTPPIPTPPPTATTPVPIPKMWHRFGNPGLNVSALAIQSSDQLFVGNRPNERGKGGLYKGSLATCAAGGTLTRILDLNVFDLVFEGMQGVLADFDTTVHYSNNSGDAWTPTTTNIKNPLTVEIAGANTFYAGTQENGIYISTDGGATWRLVNNEPKKINVLSLNTNTLWVGTDADSVFVFVTGSSVPEPRNNGLTGESKKVWDFAFDAAQVYIATFDGVYKSDISATLWQPFGLQGQPVYSVEVVDDQLYAGLRDPENRGTQAGVQRRPVNGGNWEVITSPGWDTTYTVRDLLYDPTHCNGLLAATDDGVWVYR